MLEQVPHFLAAAVLGYEFGIGVRSGCFCAHPYILHILGLTGEQSQMVRQRMLAHDKSEMPGLLRASFGLYNNTQEIDALVDALQHIARGDYKGVYTQNKATGEYIPADWNPDFSQYFSF